MLYLKQINIKQKRVRFPIFLPDATRAVVRSLDSVDLQKVGTEGLVVNTYHLMQNPGLSVLKDYKGIGNYMGFSGLITSDSGGFQIMSLLHQKKMQGEITEKGIEFLWLRKGKKEKILLTPEKCIQAQFTIGADIFVCLDYFTNPDGTEIELERSVKLTIDWAKRCKVQYLKEIDKRGIKKSRRPLLMGVIQGGEHKNLRAKCARALVDLDFDIYGYGGWPMDSKGKFNRDLFQYNASLTPDTKPRFALGVGMPEDIILGFQLGYHFFDCVLPTRDARHYRLYTFKKKPNKALLLSGQKFYDFIYINKDRYMRDQKPISQYCSCYTCQHYSKAYLNQLFKIKESLAWRLATIHNLYFYNSLIQQLREYTN